VDDIVETFEKLLRQSENLFWGWWQVDPG